MWCVFLTIVMVVPRTLYLKQGKKKKKSANPELNTYLKSLEAVSVKSHH